MLAPYVSQALAVVIELPIMLIVSWMVCKRLITKLLVPRGLNPRAAMGALAFNLLMVAESSTVL